MLESLSRRRFLKSLATGLTGLVLLGIPNIAAATATYPYSVQKVNNEYRLFREGRQHEDRHFMSVITQDNNGGILAIKPHPNGLSNDNAWGSTLYLQPFLPEATLKNTIVQEPVVDNDSNDGNTNGITISASGKVSKGATETFGAWTFSMKFAYINDYRIESTRAGRYSITLDDTLNVANGDLNLLKVASNYLHNVPRLGDTNGDTGDMSRLDIFFNDRLKRTWIPTQGTTYPGDSTNILTLNLTGNYNNVDTLAQGHGFRIEPAYKPNMRIRMKRLTSDPERTPMILGTDYDKSQSQNFAADNVGITPLILQVAPEKTFNFDITFESIPFEKNSARGWDRYE